MNILKTTAVQNKKPAITEIQFDEDDEEIIDISINDLSLPV